MGRNMLVDGEWETDVELKAGDDSEYQRVDAPFRDRIQDDPTADFRPEPDRYHLYISRSCPWSHGAALVRRINGLVETISMDILDPIHKDGIWEFLPEKEGCTPDTVNGFDYLHKVYVKADPDFTGRATTPVLWDREHETIVNNESIEIMRMLNEAFTDHTAREVDLYPEGYRREVDRIIDAIYDPLNNGVYRAGFADSQTAYEKAVEEVFDALDHWNDVLSDRRYLAGDRFTLADIRLFPTLVRFDEVYHTYFKCNRKRIEEYEALWPYLRDVYQTPGVAETVKMTHIGQTYLSEAPPNPKGIIPIGPDPAFDARHDRDQLSK